MATEGNDIITGTTGDDTLFGLGGNDRIDGLAGVDMLDGGAGSDTLIGGPGADTLTGGTGIDFFLDSAANFNGDHITDFLPGDRIQFTDLTVGNANFNLAGSTLSYNGGLLHIDNIGPGRLIIRPITSGGVEVRLQQPAHNDFDGDGFSDILWRNNGGLTTDWLAQPSGGFSGNSANFLAQVDNGWQIAGTGDFNGDGRVDLLWRNSAGLTTDWLAQANGNFGGNSGNFLAQVDTSWHIVGTGDFNGDGRSDILWRNDAGLTTNWLAQANGSFFGNSGAFLTQFDPGWSVAGTGDFNGDGYDDVLWRKADGTVTDWLGQADGSLASNSGTFQSQVVTGWHIVGSGDFNGDGLSDILWRENGGTFTDWLGQSNGTFAGNSANALHQLDPSWQVAQIGDFNGDAIDDILWRNSNGTVTEWLGQSNGSFVANNLNVQVDNSWHIQPTQVFL